MFNWIVGGLAAIITAGHAAFRRLPYRGGNWNNGERAGVSAVNLNNPRTNTNTNIGARPAFERNKPESII